MPGKNVLLIEDDSDFSAIVRLRLTRGSWGFSVECVETLAAGMERIQKGGIDVVLMDLGLRDSQGIQTFLDLHAQAPHLPTVILSAANQHQLAIEAIQSGAQDYLTKGNVDGLTLSRALFYAIERHEIQDALDSATTGLKKANDRLERLALLDPLTELYNRRGLEKTLIREIECMRRGAPSAQVILVDLDNFKQINDSLGYAMGDIVLRDTARKLQTCLRATDHLARIGGDEFMIILPRTGPEEGARIAERVRLAICQSPISITQDRVIQVSGSLGMIAASSDASSIDELLSRSHAVLMRSKTVGKNRVSSDAPFETGIRGILDSLRSGECLRSVKQPILNLQEGQIVGYEYLSRCSENSLTMPDDFFRCCAENNMLTLIDHHCLRQSVQASASLPAGLRRHLNIFPSTMVNIPVENLLNSFKGFRDGSYCMEISEQQIVGDPAYLLSSVTAFKNAGMLIAIDDVGFGRSCVESLVLMEPDIIKIDKRMVLGLSESHDQQRAMKRLLRVAEALAAEVIAEGIESQKDAEVLMEMGVLYGQGYLLGRPV